MSLRKFPLIEGESYHIFSRGNDKRKIFHDAADYKRFIKLLYLANSDENFRLSNIKEPLNLEIDSPLVSIGAYCLMPNHFHLLLKQKTDGGISKFMLKLLTGYSMYYNTRYERTGSLFEGKFKSELIDSDNYLKYIFSYIHLNPIKLIYSDWKDKIRTNEIDRTKLIDFLNTYDYSSYLDYLDKKRVEGVIIDREDFPNYFPNKRKFMREIVDWINYDNNFLHSLPLQGKAS